MREHFANALKEALKAKDTRRVSTVRLIQAAIKDRDIANRGHGKDPVGDDEILQILAKMIKQREESAATYEQGGRPELAAGEREEIAIIREYMPRQLSSEETRAAVAAAITETGAASIKDMGKVMAALKARHTGQMDFGKAGAVVKELLSSPK